MVAFGQVRGCCHALTIKLINEELKRLGHDGQLVKGDGYFYFKSGEAATWLDTTVRAPTLNSLTLEACVAEFDRLKKLNHNLLSGHAAPGTAEKHQTAKKTVKQK